MQLYNPDESKSEEEGDHAGMEEKKCYLAIDLKAFYASVECREHGKDPLTTNLVVADLSRTEKTICLAVSPSLKALGISGRPRLFEVVQQVALINEKRLQQAPGHRFRAMSSDAEELERDPTLGLDYIVAKPRMSCYLEYSGKVYEIYTNYVSETDIHVYSVDEVFIDATDYLRRNNCTARAFAQELLAEVLRATGITATVGIGSNLYLSKIAMDILAKRMPPDGNGARIAELDEQRYRALFWTHQPLTDFWRVGGGIARRLAQAGLYTMGDIARCSMGGREDYFNEELLVRLFGVNAELLIDHAWGWEPCTIRDIKEYCPLSSSMSVGQVLPRAYGYEETKTILREMAEDLAMNLFAKGLLTDQVVLSIGYDRIGRKEASAYKGELRADYYGRSIPRHSHGSENLPFPMSSVRHVTAAVLQIYERCTDRRLSVRRIIVAAEHVTASEQARKKKLFEQMDLLQDKQAGLTEEELLRERKLQEALQDIRSRYGNNTLLYGVSYQEGATGKERHGQIGGHRA